MRKRMIALIVFGGLIGLLLIWYIAAPQLGGKSRGESLALMKKSSYYREGKFTNIEDTPLQDDSASMFDIMKKFMKSSPSDKPNKPIVAQEIQLDKYSEDNSDILFTWLGHSTLLLNLKGLTVLTDPVFSKRTSPLSFIGTKRFDYTPNYTADDLPPIDVVLISHDHYDHLDYKSIKALKSKAKLFLVPLGCKAHLLRWGIEASMIIEKEWGETHSIDSTTILHCTPSRHFSGRKGFDQNATLWCSWVLQVKEKKIYFSGDSGYGEHFKEIGAKYGPFDMAFMECGQYNEAWPYIHMMPEQTLQAGLDVKAAQIIPIHWGKYKLSLHSWTDPVDRLLAALKEDDIKILTPRVGESIAIPSTIITERWWEEYQYR